MEDVIVIGGGPSGLAVAACLKHQGVTPLILEREQSVGSAWRRHYDRLSLHTARGRSSLPLRPFPKDWPRYVPRAQVVEYLEDYADHFDLNTIFGAEVTEVTPEGGGWNLRHGKGSHQARAVVMATGFAETPRYGDWPGLDRFPGPILHTRFYKAPSDLPGRCVLVVGFGNSGSEIALDLVEDGREVTMAVRSPVNLLPKEILGVPTTSLGFLQTLLPYKVVDALNAPILRMILGDYTRYGLRKADKGPLAQIHEDGQIPMIDLGTLDHMRAGRIRVKPGLERLEGDEVVFVDGSRAAFDAILMATGYTVDLRPMLGRHPALDEEGRPRESGAEVAPGLWTISYHAVPNGQLKEINIQSQKLAGEIGARLKAVPASG